MAEEQRSKSMKAVRPRCGVPLGVGLYLSIGDAFLPTGPAWAILIVWLASNIGGFLSELVCPTHPIFIHCAIGA